MQRLGTTEIDPREDIRPTVNVIETSGKFKDLLVRTRATTAGILRIGTEVNANAGFVFQVVVEERNFDPFRWPTSKSDWTEGRAFRETAGKVQLELTRLKNGPGMRCGEPVK